MQKLMYLLVLPFLLLSFVACEGPAGPPGYDGLDVNLKVLFVEVKANDWKQDNDVSTWYVDFNAPEITSDVINSGYVLFYLKTTSSNADSWTPLPSTSVFTDKNGVTYSEEIIPWHSPGKLQFQYVDSHPTSQVAPGDFTFKVVIANKEIANVSKNISYEELSRIVDLKNARIVKVNSSNRME